MALAWILGISGGPPRSGPGLVIGFTKQNKKHRAPASCSKIISQGKQTTGRPQGGEAHFPLAEGTALDGCRMQSPYAGNDSQKYSILADSASFQKLHPLGRRARKWLWTGYSGVFSLCSEVERTACKRKHQMVLEWNRESLFLPVSVSPVLDPGPPDGQGRAFWAQHTAGRAAPGPDIPQGSLCSWCPASFLPQPVRWGRGRCCCG